MAAHGKLEQFHMGQDDRESYEECLQQYLVWLTTLKKPKNRGLFFLVRVDKLHTR